MARAGNDLGTGPTKNPETEDGKPNIKYWLGQLDAYDKAARSSLKNGQEAYDEYTMGGNRADVADTQLVNDDVRYPLYWSASRIRRTAIYSRTPVPICEKAIEELEDNVARLTSIMGERRANYCIRACNFDEVQGATCDDFIHTGRATNRVCFKADMEQPPEDEQQEAAPEGPAPDDQMQPPGMPPMGQPPQMQQPMDPAMAAQMAQQQMSAPIPGALPPEMPGYMPLETIVAPAQPKVKSISVELLPVHFKDIRHNPNARWESEITWKSFDSWMTRPDVEERFGKETADLLNYTPLKDSAKDKGKGNSDERTTPELGVTITEIWNLRKKEVYWTDRKYKEEFLDVKPDPYELRGFFPCPKFIIGTRGPNSLFAVPDFIQLRSQFNQLHGNASRLRTVMRASRVTGIVDGSIPEIEELMTTGEAEWIFIAKFKELFGERSIDDVIRFFPTKELADAASKLMESMTTLEQNVYSLWGIPDILRGITDPNITVEAQQQAGKFISGMFSSIQHEFQRLVRDSIELMVDICSTKFPLYKRQEIDGFRFMTPEDQALWPQCDQLLQNDDERLIRIDIETDSTHTMNQNAEIEQANYLAKTVSEGLASVSTAAQQNPLYGVAAMKSFLIVIRRLRDGKLIEEELQPVLDAMMQQAQQPPPPDPEIAKNQAKMEIENAKAQAKMQIENMKNQSTIQQEATRVQADVQINNSKIQGDMARQQQKAQHQAAIAQIQTAANQKELALEAQLLQLKSSLAQQTAEHKAVIDATLKKFEMQQEAKRTAAETAAAYTTAPPSPVPNITLKMEPAPPRVHKIARDAMGNIAAIESKNAGG